MQILVSSGYIYLIKAVEVIAGLFLIANRWVTLAIVLLGADIANIAAYHLLLDHRDWPIVPIIVVLYAVVLWEYRAQLKCVFRWGIQGRFAEPEAPE